MVEKFINLCFDQDRPKQLQNGVARIVINSQVSAEGQSEDLKALAKLISNKPVKLNKYFDHAQRRIKEVSEDPETREKIIPYETRMLEREQVAGGAGCERGEVDSAKITPESQLNNSRVLGQAMKFVRDLKLIPSKELEKVVAIYKQ